MKKAAIISTILTCALILTHLGLLYPKLNVDVKSYLILLFAPHILGLIFFKGFKRTIKSYFLSVILLNILSLIFLAFIIFIAIQPTQSEYSCISENDRYILTPDSLSTSYKVPGVYEVSDLPHPASHVHKHRFYFLPSKSTFDSWKSGQLILEIQHTEPDTTIFVYGLWKLKDKNKSALIGDFNYEVSTTLMGKLKIEGNHSFMIDCFNDKPEIHIKIKRQDLGGVDDIHKYLIKGSPNQLLDYINFPNMPVDKEYEIFYKKVREIDSLILKRFD